MKKNSLILFTTFVSCHILSQDTLYILTSAPSEQCKQNLGCGLNNRKRIIHTQPRLDNKDFTPIIDTTLLRLVDLAMKMNEKGYDANEKPALIVVYNQLSMACSKEYNRSR